MPGHVLERAFEPFFSTRPKSQGQGLGLTLVHSVVRLHGGQVVLESAEDKGTTVRIWIPSVSNLPVAPSIAPLPPKFASPKIPTAPAPASSPPPASAVPKKRVLLVDDDPLVLEVIKAFLQRANYEVLVAQDGQEGLRLYQRYAKELTLVVSDVTMPKMGGIELSHQIRKLNPAMRIVLVSGDADATRAEALASIPAPIPPLVRKPFTLKDLMDIIRQQTS